MHIRTRRRFRLLPSARAMEAGTHHQAQPSSAQQSPAAHPTGPGWRGRAGMAGDSTHPADVTIRTSPVTELLWGARASGRLLIIHCANCTWLFLSCEINSPRGKQLTQNANLRAAGAHVQHCLSWGGTQYPTAPPMQARPPYLHHADEPSVQQLEQAAASTRGTCSSPGRGPHHSSRSAAAKPSLSPGSALMARAFPACTAPAAPPLLAGSAGGAAEAMAAAAGVPSVAGWGGGAGGDYRRLQVLVPAQRFLYIPLSALNGLCCSAVTTFPLPCWHLFWFQTAQKKQLAEGNWEKEQANREPGQTVLKGKK